MGQLEQFHREMREFDRKFGPEDWYDRRLREKREEEERKRRHEPPPQPTAQQQSPAERKAWEKDWNDGAAASFNTFLLAVMAKDGWMCEVIGGAIGKKAADVRKHMLDEVATLRRELVEATAKLQERLARLPLVKTWDADEISYCGDVVTHDGSVWQARRDTGKEPGHADWLLLARAGHDGYRWTAGDYHRTQTYAADLVALAPDVIIANGAPVTEALQKATHTVPIVFLLVAWVRQARDEATRDRGGAFDPGKKYERLDIVEFHGASYIARCDDPGACPGDDDTGWQLLSRGGPRGDTGAVGPRGRKGERGARGEDAPTVIAWTLDHKNYTAVPTMSNGRAGAPLELRGLFENFLIETQG